MIRFDPEDSRELRTFTGNVLSGRTRTLELYHQRIFKMTGIHLFFGRGLFVKSLRVDETEQLAAKKAVPIELLSRIACPTVHVGGRILLELYNPTSIHIGYVFRLIGEET